MFPIFFQKRNTTFCDISLPNISLTFLAVPPLSAEEDRLWNIVRANSLDFNSWTSLIEETEKVAEVCKNES